jgi:DNA-binding SARP family transcriptional activator
MASSMYFNPSDSSFYAVCMKNGGTLWKISMKDSVCMEISKPIHNELVYQDCDFSLYKSLNYHKMFLVIDKILSNKVHNIAIYSINTPVIGEEEIVQSRNKTSMIMWVLFSSFLLILCIIVVCVIYYSHRKKKQNPINLKNEDDALQYGLKIDEFKNLQVENEKNEIYFDRSRSAISLLGTFNVRDKSGRDITCSFSPRLKELLIFLILNTEKDNQGVLAKRVMDTLWNDKDEISARNNCNVTLRKLRILLESIGKVEVLSDSGFLRIVWGEDVFCDYHASLSCIKYFKQNELKGDRSLLNEVLEILLYGPLLSNTILEWIDEFKDAYSSISIDLLSELLHLGLQQQNDILVLRIADTMFLHDPLNEEALSAKCSILFSQGKKGIAKSVYERFCKEYKDLLGENYKTSLSDLYK